MQLRSPFWWKNRNDSSVLPADVADYYQSQGSARKGIAVLIGLASLAVTVVIALGIFFGSRWVYRHTFGKPKNTTTASKENKQTTTVNTGQSSSEATNPSSSQSTSSEPTTPATGGTEQGSGSANRLINTGPGEDL
jgi:cytoskeletal protein RodZ